MYSAWLRLESPSGAVLIDYWQSWLARQSALTSPSGKPLAWVPGINVSHSFTIPAIMRDRVQTLAGQLRAVRGAHAPPEQEAGATH